MLGGSAHPYLLARVRWPDVAQAMSEDCPGWLDDPGLFDLPYDPASERVSSARAAQIAAEWGAQLPLDSTPGFSEPRFRRIPPTWSDMVPVEKRSWSLEHVTDGPRSRGVDTGRRMRRCPPTATRGPRRNDRHQDDAAGGRRRAAPHTEARPPSGERLSVAGPLRRPGSATAHPPSRRPPPLTTACGASTSVRGRRRRRHRRQRLAPRPTAAGPELVSGGGAGCSSWLRSSRSVVLVAVLLRLTLIAPFTVPSSAMAPTLQAGDRILVLRSSFVTGSIGRGDIIVFHRPKFFPCQTSGTGQYLVERVIGLPGETISSSHQTIYIDGKQIAERGWYDPDHGAVASVQIPKTTIPKGDYFVLADNRSNSCDSRSFGPIPGSSTLGKVVAVIARNGTPYLHLF